MNARKIASVVAGVGVLCAAGAKMMNGESPNMTEALLAVSTISAAFGFQKDKGE